MKSVIITGVGGFVGNNLADYLAERGLRVYGLWHNHKPKEHKNTVSLIQVDLADIDEVRYKLSDDRFREVDAIIHLAAQLPKKGCTMNDFVDNTINATKNIVAYAQEKEIHSFIYMSSIAVYGDTKGEVTEDTDRVNLSDYGMAKYIGERIVEDADISGRIILRLPRMLGKGMTFERPWVPALIWKLANGEEVKYYNPDIYFNQLAHVDSLSEFLIELLQRKEKQCIKLGIGASEPIRIIEVIELLRKLLDSNSEIININAEKKDSVSLLNLSEAVSFGFRPWTVKETLERIVCDLGM